MTECQREGRRSSSGNMDFVNPSGKKKKKRRKASAAFKQAFQGRKSEDPSESRGSSMVEYLRGKRSKSHSGSSLLDKMREENAALPLSWQSDVTMKSFKKISPSNSALDSRRVSVSDSTSPQRDINAAEAHSIVDGFSPRSLGKRRKSFGWISRKSGFSEKTTELATGSVEVFASGSQETSELIEIRCEAPLSEEEFALSDNGYDDYDVASIGSENSHGVSRESSMKSRSSLSPNPISPHRPPQTVSKERGSPNIFRRLSTTLTPRAHRKVPRGIDLDEQSLRHLRRLSIETVETSVKRHSSDVTKDVFDSWDGRNAMTLPRTSKKGLLHDVTPLEDANPGLRPSIIQRPQSVMLTPPTTHYSLGSSPNEFPIQNAMSRLRPTSTMTSYHGNPMITDSVQMAGKRSSYHEDADGAPGSLASHSRDHERIFASHESLDEASMDISDIENDPDLMVRSDDPDSWSATIDKKSLKRLSLTKKEIKRQENIFEFIQTERNHLTTLKIMQKVYAGGLARELNLDASTRGRLFPLIDEHVEFVAHFVQKLTDCQKASKVVSGIGDTLLAQLSGERGEKMKKLFGDFCSKQNEATNYFKEMMKTDKKFNSFMRKWDKNPVTRRQDVPACALLITQRITKYPMMIQTLIENSSKKENKEEYKNLERSLELSREIAKAVNEQVQDHERQELLLEVFERTEGKSSSPYKKNLRFDRKDLIKPGRKLLHKASVHWNVKDNKKFTEVEFLLLTDCIVFLQESNGKFAFPSGQPSVVPLQKMIVREVAGDDNSLYLMSMTTQLMYTLKLSSADDCSTLIHKIRLAIGNCPDEDESATGEEESHRKQTEQKDVKAKNAMRQLELTDQRINRMLEEKMKFFKTLAESANRSDAIADLHFSIPYYPTEEGELPPGSPILLRAIQQASKLSHALYGTGGISRYPSCVSEHAPRAAVALPKRSDTFGGFDKDKVPAPSRAKWLNSSQSDSKLAEMGPMRSESSGRDRDSGLVDSETATHHSDSQISIAKTWDPSVDALSDTSTSLDGGCPPYFAPTPEQVQALTILAHTLSEYQSVAAQQDTLIEGLQHQLSSQDRSSSASKKKGLEEVELKRNQIRQQEEMDELRKQQHQLRAEREQWNKQIERFERSLDNEKKDLQEQKAKLLLEKEENERIRMEMQKTMEAQQRELAQLQKKKHHDHSSSANRNHSNNHVAKAEELHPDNRTPARSHTSLQSGKRPSSQFYANPSDYPRTFPRIKRDSPPAITSQMPIHLQQSVTNPKTAETRHESRPARLLRMTSSSKSKAGSDGAAQQPGKLSKLGHHSASSLENLKNFAAFRNNKRKPTNSLPEAPNKPPEWTLPANSVSAPRRSSSSEAEKTRIGYGEDIELFL